MTSKHSTALSRFAGRWEQDDDGSEAVYEITIKNGKPVVAGFDKRDGERLKISGVKWDGKGLSFTAFMPSTRWRTWHRLTLVRVGIMNHELTVVERWKRIPLRDSDK